MTNSDAKSSAKRPSTVPTAASSTMSLMCSRASANSTLASSMRVRNMASALAPSCAIAPMTPPCGRLSLRSNTGSAAADQYTDEETARRGGADRLPRVVAYVIVGDACGHLGAVDGIILKILQLHLRRHQLRFDLRAQIARPFARFRGGLLEQGFGFREYIAEILDQRFSGALQFCSSHGPPPWMSG